MTNPSATEQRVAELWQVGKKLYGVGGGCLACALATWGSTTSPVEAASDTTVMRIISLLALLSGVGMLITGAMRRLSAAAFLKQVRALPPVAAVSLPELQSTFGRRRAFRLSDAAIPE